MYCNACTRLGYHEMAATSAFGLDSTWKTKVDKEAALARARVRVEGNKRKERFERGVDPFFTALKEFLGRHASYHPIVDLRESSYWRNSNKVLFDIIKIAIVRNAPLPVPYGIIPLQADDTFLDKNIKYLINRLPTHKVADFVEHDFLGIKRDSSPLLNSGTATFGQALLLM
jgi:hypothetical protein